MATKSAHPPVRMPPHPLGKSCEPREFEARLYEFWEKNGCFEAADKSAAGQGAFCIVIPPPNVTGILHMGHALTNTIQDLLIRWRRMKGDNTLWLPGTDHAGIATQAQVEKAIAKEGKGPSGRPLSRHDLGREKFVARSWKWKEEHAGQITDQLRRLGSSLDWKRERFTMDEGLSRAVREVFVRLHEQDLIYRGERIINWCPRCQTALSDLEVIPTERRGKLWHLRYEIVEADGGAAGSVVIATTRPETLLGDTAVAVHPEDERYLALHGKFAVLPLLKRRIPVITDAYVDREFGSGALKVTPAHDFNDAELGARQKLPIVQVMGKDGRITAEGGPYAGLKYVGSHAGGEAREKVVADLEAEGALVRTEDHANKVGLCQRCEQIAEPMVSKQWFVKIEPLARPAIEAVERGRIVFSPKNWEKTYFEWMHNIRDWCISRQLWWGHQIPAWHCSACEGITVARETPKKCSRCKAGADKLRQDEDVLDTWFSSALWPFSTLGWPEKSQALKTFYPTAILETGFDIIFFWVARMIMMGLHFMGEVPFRRVYLHAMVRDERGEKMSKSKGNVIDPLEIVDKHGTDALRFTLAAMAGQGRDVKLSVDRVEGNRAFCNKLWNATKFLHLQLEAVEPIAEPAGGLDRWIHDHRITLSYESRWILSRLNSVMATVGRSFDEFELNVGATALYEFAWHELCDWFVEFAKLPLKEGGDARRETVYVLHFVLEKLLRLLHPIIPFVTEELWQSLPWKGGATTTARKAHGAPDIVTLMLQRFPEEDRSFADIEAERTIGALRAIIEALRNFRGENGISPKVEFPVRYVPGSPAAHAFIKQFADEIQALARVSSIEFVRRGEEESGEAGAAEAIIPVTQPPLELRIDLKGLVDVEGESRRLAKEVEKAQVDLAFVREKLGRESFVARAPADLVAQERLRETEMAAKLQELQKALERLRAQAGGG